MNAPLCLWRRCLCAVTAIGAAFLVLRPQLAQALVVRGDGLLYQGRSDLAIGYYRRALSVEGDSEAAVDRLASFAFESHNRSIITRVLPDISAFIRRHGDRVAIRFDRGLCYESLRDFRHAEADFASAGYAGHDARSLEFAGFAALHQVKPARARRYFRDALRFDASLRPAKRALVRIPS